jgi:hypothetical protein
LAFLTLSKNFPHTASISAESAFVVILDDISSLTAFASSFSTLTSLVFFSIA